MREPVTLMVSIMGRPAYRIQTPQDSLAAKAWVENQFKKSPFWLEVDDEGQTDFDRRYEAEQAWKKKKSGADALQAWCETWLRTDDWVKLKNAIRAARLTTEKKSIEIDYEAWLELKDYADRKKLTLSQAILALTKARK